MLTPAPRICLLGEVLVLIYIIISVCHPRAKNGTEKISKTLSMWDAVQDLLPWWFRMCVSCWLNCSGSIISGWASPLLLCRLRFAAASLTGFPRVARGSFPAHPLSGNPFATRQGTTRARLSWRRKMKQFSTHCRHQVTRPAVTREEAALGWVLARMPSWKLTEATVHRVGEHAGLSPAIHISTTSRGMGGGHGSPSLGRCSQSPEQKLEFFVEPHEEKDEMRCLTPVSMILSSQPLENRASTSHSVTYNTHILLRKEQQVHWIYSFATFCPQLLCALPTDAKIIQFTECYASAHWTLWDSPTPAEVIRKLIKETEAMYRLADAELSDLCM